MKQSTLKGKGYCFTAVQSIFIYLYVNFFHTYIPVHLLLTTVTVPKNIHLYLFLSLGDNGTTSKGVIIGFFIQLASFWPFTGIIVEHENEGTDSSMIKAFHLINNDKLLGYVRVRHVIDYSIAK